MSNTSINNINYNDSEEDTENAEVLDEAHVSINEENNSFTITDEDSEDFAVVDSQGGISEENNSLTGLQNSVSFNDIENEIRNWSSWSSIVQIPYTANLLNQAGSLAGAIEQALVHGQVQGQAGQAQAQGQGQAQGQEQTEEDLNVSGLNEIILNRGQLFITDNIDNIVSSANASLTPNTSSSAIWRSLGIAARRQYNMQNSSYFVDSLTGATIKDGRAKVTLENKSYDANLLAEYLLYSKFFKCPRDCRAFSDADLLLIYESLTTPGLKERLENCERLPYPSQKIIASKFFSEIASTIVFQLLSSCELESIESIQALQKSMDLLWGSFIQALSALLLYDPLLAALKSLDLKTCVDEAVVLSSNNPEEIYMYEPTALEPLRHGANELCTIVTLGVLKLTTLDAIAKIQPIKIIIL